MALAHAASGHSREEPVMLRPILRRIGLALLLSGAGSASALTWWDRCNCQPAAFDPLPPAYVYDHSVGPTWSANGWSYPPVGVYYPVTIAPVPYAAPYRVDYLGAPAPRLPLRGGYQPLK
jgi:hypothetical protein